MKLHNLFGLALVLALTGCGGGGGSDSTDNSGGEVTPPVVPTVPEAFTLKAIDGYLVDAEVYVDRNSDMVADASEFMGYTNVSGEFPISKEDSVYRIIVRAVGGQTFDLDTGGRVGRTYEMISEPGTKVISPYSTLAVVNGVTTESIANDVGYSEEAISGDYVDAKGTDADAEKVHLMARSTVKQLGTTIKDTDANKTAITTTVDALPAKIADLENDGADLDTVVINKDGATKNMMPTVNTYLNDVTLYQFSTNEKTFEDKGYSQLEFEKKPVARSYSMNMAKTAAPANDTKVLRYSNLMTAEAFTADVDVEFNEYTRSNDSRTDDFIYLSDDFALTVSSAGTLDFSTTDASIVDANTGRVNFNFLPAEDTMFRGKTVYWLIDVAEGSETPEPVLNMFKFDLAGNMGYFTREGMQEAFEWFINADGQLTIDRENEMKDLIFQPVIYTSDMIVTVMRHAPLEDHKYSNIPMFLVTDENLATNLYNEWANK